MHRAVHVLASASIALLTVAAPATGQPAAPTAAPTAPAPTAEHVERVLYDPTRLQVPNSGWLQWEREADTRSAGALRGDPLGAEAAAASRAERDRPRPTAADRRDHLDGPESDEGFQVAGGGSSAGDGDLVTFTVELDGEVDVDLSEVVEIVETALYDPRSWASDHTLERGDDPTAADIRVVLATPDTVDTLCAEADLDTNGTFSCWNGTFAALNAMRWQEGAADFGDDLETYRTYLVNHEFGHGLGHGHVDCPSPGELAPVMMQQTRGTEGCDPNGWPYPDTLDTDDAETAHHDTD